MNDRPDAQDASFDLTEQALPWQDLVASIFRHRKVVFVLLAVGIVVGAVRGWTLPPTYRASALLLVRDNLARLTVSPDARTGPVIDRGEQQVNSLAALVRSPTLVREVLKEKYPDAPDVEPELTWFEWILNLPTIIYRWLHDVPDANLMERRAQSIANAVRVTPLSRSNLIEVSYYSGSPHWSAQLVNDLVAKVISKYTSLHDIKNAKEFYSDQRALLAQRLEEGQNALQDFRLRVGPDILTLNGTQLRDRMVELEQARLAAKTQLAELEARAETPPEFSVPDETAPDPSLGNVVNPAANALRARILELEIKRSELITRYTPGSVLVSELDRQILEAKRLLDKERSTTIAIWRQEMKGQLDTARARLRSIDSQLAEYRTKLTQFDSVAPELERLQTEVDTQRQAYLNYHRKEEEARFSTALDESDIVNVAIAEPAKLPRDPEPVPLLKYVVLGAGMCTVIGILLALLRDWIDPAIKSTNQAERLSGVPVLGEISL